MVLVVTPCSSSLARGDEDVGDVSQPLVSHCRRRAQIPGETSFHLQLSMTSAVRHTGPQLRGSRVSCTELRLHLALTQALAGQNKEVDELPKCSFDALNSVVDLRVQVGNENFMK